MVLVAGVDEAGRGCAIGPLVVAGVLFEESAIDTLQKMDVRDSKQLSRRKRDKRTRNIYQITMKGEQVIRYFKGAKELQLGELGLPF